MKPQVLVEIIACSLDDCLAVEAAGAHRIELCGGIALGGLTPSIGLLREAKRRCGLPLMAMLRPREAGMAYTPGEYDTMLADLDALLGAGADGIVTGISLPGGALDAARLAPIAEKVRAAGRELVCHRAFDLTPDPLDALETLIELGFDRVLTSGQRATAAEGADLIAELVSAARGRITILPACGIEAANAATLVARTGVREIHLAAFAPAHDPSTREGAVSFGVDAPEDPHAYPRTDREIVAGVVGAVAPTNLLNLLSPEPIGTGEGIPASQMISEDRESGL